MGGKRSIKGRRLRVRNPFREREREKGRRFWDQQKRRSEEEEVNVFASGQLPHLDCHHIHTV
jgi:hypothetical protein